MGVTRKAISVTTDGLAGAWSDRERIARNTKATVIELRRQTELMRRARANAAPLVQINLGVAPPAPQPPAPQPPVARPKPSRKSWTETLTERPDVEIKWWIIWAAVTLFCAVASPASLLISLPVGIYLFHCRQQAAKARAVAAIGTFDAEQAIREAQAFGFPTDVYRAQPEPRGRHAR